MKILQINAVYGVGSTGVIVQDIHKTCLSRGIDSYVAYSTSPLGADKITNGYEIGKPFGKKLHALLSRICGKQAYFSKYSTKKLINYIDYLNPDIVHLHNLHSNYVNLNRLLEFLAKKNIKTVITLHDCWFYTGGCFHYTSVNCSAWRESCGNCPKRFGDTPAYLSDRSAEILSNRREYFGKIKNLSVVGVSEWITKECEKSVVSAKRYETVYNGIDTEFFKPVTSDIRKTLGLENKFVILTMANKWLLPVNSETLKRFSEGIGDDSVILMVGADKATESLPSNVIPYGYIRDRQILREVYSAADVFVNCTREESLSLVNVEAQSCGTPVVTYRNTGAQETVDGECGFSVETGNADALHEAVLSIKQDGKEKYSKKCREFVMNRFDKEKNYNKLLELYYKILDED